MQKQNLRLGQRVHAHISKHFQKKIQKHLEEHGHHRIHHIHHVYHRVSHSIIHLGEMIVAAFVGLFFILSTHASPSLLVNNTALVYPISDVAKLECRPGVWSELDKSCIMKLPLIKNANYGKYTQDDDYHFYYSVLWRATYKDGWDPEKGGHAGLDIPSILGTPMYSIADGKVYYAGWQNGYGNVIKIKFRYQGKNYYAVYAHANKIFVKKGQTVHRGQKIAEVGNTGMTFGGGGGYHLHFEINKEKKGRLEYYLTGCPDRSKGEMTITNNGLCRKEIAEHQVDPVKFLESAGATLVQTEVKEEVKEEVKDTVPLKKGDEGGSESIPAQEKQNQEEVKKDSSDKPQNDKKVKEEEVKKEEEKKEEEVKKEEEKKEEVKEDSSDKSQNDKKVKEEEVKEDSSDKSQNDKKVKEEEVKEDSSDKPQNDKKVKKEEVKKEEKHNAAPEKIIFDDEEGLIATGNEISLEIEELSALGKHFFSQYELKIYTSLLNKEILDTQHQHKILLTLVKKSDNKKYEGLIDTPLSLLTKNNNIKLFYNHISFFQKGKATIDVTINKKGKTAILINLGRERIAVVKLDILK